MRIPLLILGAIVSQALASEIMRPAGVRGVLTPPERLTVSEWCDRYRHLNDKYCAEPGPWRTARAPWIREIQDSFADPAVSSIIFVKGSRVSGTEAMNNMLAFSADQRPMPALFVLPRKPDVQDEFSGRIRSIFEDSPRLSAHIPGGNWATEEQIGLDTMTVYGAAASTSGDLIRRTIGIAFFDEVDNCESQSTELGSVWSLIEKRLTTYGYRAKLVGVSTPSLEEGAAWQELLRSDYRRYFLPCPRCGGYQVLSFEQLRWPTGEHDPDRIEQQELVRYQCEHCKAEIEDREKSWMVDRGIWVPKCQRVEEVLDVNNPEQVAAAATGAWRPSLAGEPPATRRRGYWMPSYYSTLGLTWSKIVGEFLRVKDDRDRYRVHVNQIRALPWREAVVVTQVDELRKKTLGALPEGIIPNAAVKLIAAADVQLHYLYYVLRAFGPGEESWLIRCGTCETFDDLYELACNTQYLYADGNGGLSCERLAIDTRYRRDEVLDFVDRRDPEVRAFYGYETLLDRWQPFSTEWYASGKRAKSVMAYKINTNFFKTKLHRLARGESFHLHAETSEEYFRHLVAEELVWVRKKNSKHAVQLWKPKREGIPNHLLDCEVYALALADQLGYRQLQSREAIAIQRQIDATRRETRGLQTPDGRPYLVTKRKA